MRHAFIDVGLEHKRQMFFSGISVFVFPIAFKSARCDEFTSAPKAQNRHQDLNRNFTLSLAMSAKHSLSSGAVCHRRKPRPYTAQYIGPQLQVDLQIPWGWIPLKTKPHLNRTVDLWYLKRMSLQRGKCIDICSVQAWLTKHLNREHVFQLCTVFMLAGEIKHFLQRKTHLEKI